MSTETQEKIIHATAQYAEKTLGSEGFRYVSTVVANCKMLALQREAQDESDTAMVDMDVLVLAAYLHDISTASQGFQQHHIASAQMAIEFLRFTAGRTRTCAKSGTGNPGTYDATYCRARRHVFA